MKRVLIALSLLLAPPVFADEGMWTFDRIPRAEIHRVLGVDLGDAWLDHVRLSTVRVGFGCTGAFVSADGLVLTNQHCAQGALADLSEPGKDLLTDGFLARARDEEKRCEGYQVAVLVRIEDVTDRIAQATRGLDELQANEVRKRTLTRLEKEALEASRKDPNGPFQVESVKLYEGGRYCLYRYKRYDDVRLVFAPEMAIAQFGGDPDNFQFPRWNLDMSLVRVYENGRPLRTPHHLQTSFSGPAEGDPVFVVGHPGRTDRLLTAEQLRTLRDLDLPLRLFVSSELRGRLAQFAKTDPERWRIAQDPILDVENSIKVRRGELAALLDEDLLAGKRQAERALVDRVAGEPELAGAVSAAFAEIARAEETFRAIHARRWFLELRGIQGSLFQYARGLVRGAAERAKPNEQRLREFTDAALPRLERAMLAPVPVYPEIEALSLSLWLERMREWLGPDDPTVMRILGADSPDSLAARLVRGTRLGDAVFRRGLWQGGAAAVDASTDPMIQFLRGLDPDARAVRARYENEVEAPELAAAQTIARARFAAFGTSLYPDATSTLRLNWGRVQGWREQGADVAPFTAFRTMYPRATGADPFALPRSWLAAREKLDLDTPFNLCTTNDIVGGNSGSPLINARGELVGLLFDGNIHSIAGSYWFDPERNRAVAIHPAAIREALLHVYDAPGLLRELSPATRAAK